MTEPIAVDTPAKPSFSRTGPGAAPVSVSLPAPTPAPAPKVEAASKPTVADATGVPPVVAPAATGLFARFTKKQLALGATAAFSLFTGIGTMRMMFPAKDDANPSVPVAAAVDDKVKLNPPAALVKAPAIEVESPRESLGTLPLLPTVPAAPVGGPPTTLKPTGISPLPPLAPPTIGVDARPPALPTLPDFIVPPPPTGLVPIGGASPTIPPAPTPPAPAVGLPPLPAVPPPTGLAPPSVIPPKPELPALPLPGGVVPPPSGDLIPKPLAPVVLPDPTPKLPLPEVKLPAAFDPKPPVGVVPPSMFPVDVNPKPEVKFPPPAFDPPTLGMPPGFTKPAGASEVKPIVPEFAPKTTFDVDVHDPKAGDTYETISLEFYNDRRFAAALRAFNQNAVIQGGRFVNVPPIHALKRQFPAQTGGTVVPVGESGVVPPATSVRPDWGAAPKPSTRNTFTVPQGGMTLPQVAKQALGNEQRWRDIYELNPWVTKPSEPLPAGTELKLP